MNISEISPNALFIIDGSYLLYRSYYGLSELKTSTGIPTQAIYGFVRTLKKIIDHYNPQSLVVVWDGKQKTFRSEIYAEYKATRQAAPSDLGQQKEKIQEILDHMSICQITQEGFEADDIIATIAHHEKIKQVLLVCPDKDMFQLLRKNLMIIDPFKDAIVTQELYEAKMGFPIERLPDYFALLGDTSDNIPGVKGIGAKGAQKLFTTYTSLDELYEKIEEVKPKGVQEKLIAQKESAYLSKRLFKLEPINMIYDVEACCFDNDNWKKAEPLFAELEFKRLAGNAKPPLPQTPEELQEQPWTCITVQTEQTLDEMIDAIKKAGVCALDTETDGVPVMQTTMIGLSFAVNEDEAYYIPLRHEELTQLSIGEQLPSNKNNSSQLDLNLVFKKLQPILEDPAIKKVLHHAKYDELVLMNEGFDYQGTSFDTLLAANLFKGTDKINLKALSLQYLNEPMKRFKDVLGKRKHFGQVPIEDAAHYGAYDSLQTFKLLKIFEKKLEEEPKLKKLYYELDLPFHSILKNMEYKGILVDAEQIKMLSKEGAEKCRYFEEKILAAVEALAPGQLPNLNINSPRQIEMLLFDILNLPVIKKNPKGSRSTDQEVLLKLQKYHPIPGMIVQHREYAKLKNTYLDPLPGYVNPKTGRIHTTFSQTLVATGRLSSSDPNLQNIPATEGLGMAIRSAFKAPKNSVLISADYSQIELRILAHVSNDKTLLDVFKNNIDVHTQTAAQLFNVELSEVTHEQRQLGKKINFSILYGLTPYGLSQDLGISPSEAKTYITTYFDQYPGIADWMEKTVQFAQRNGYVETLYGRRRTIPNINERNKHLFDAAKRIAINTPIQGTQADLMKISMIKTQETLNKKKLSGFFTLQIHDEIILEVPTNEEKETIKAVQECMENIVQWEIPLNVTIRTGPSWEAITK